MVGKKNIVFGFLYLALTASLGPVMLVKYFPDVGAAEAAKQVRLGALQQAAAGGFLNADLEPMTAADIAKADAAAILALSAVANSRTPIDAIKGGPHAHGNLEALLNIAVGVVLGLLAVPVLFKQIISWVFILGTLLHSGLLYLAVGLQLPWAGRMIEGGLGYPGPILILLGLLLAGVAAWIGWRGRPVEDPARH